MPSVVVGCCHCLLPQLQDDNLDCDKVSAGTNLDWQFSLTNMTQMRKRVLKTKIISIGTYKTPMCKSDKESHTPASPTHPSACPLRKGKQVASPCPPNLRSQKCHCGHGLSDLREVLQPQNIAGYRLSLLVNWQIGLEL